MTDLISRQAALDIIDSELSGWLTDDERMHLEIVAMGTERLPTIDAVPVVRCKECKHYKFADNRAFGMPVKRCEVTGFEDVDDNDFCSRGERCEEGSMCGGCDRMYTQDCCYCERGGKGAKNE